MLIVVGKVSLQSVLGEGVLTQMLLTTEFSNKFQCHLVSLFCKKVCSIFG